MRLVGPLFFLSFVLESLVATYFYFNPFRASHFVHHLFRYLLAFNMFMAGLMHFPASMYKFYASMIPLPYKKFWVLSSGVAMVLFASALCFERFASPAAYCIAITFVVIFPANIMCVFDPYPRRIVCGGSKIFALARLPFQATFIAWALWIAGR